MLMYGVSAPKITPNEIPGYGPGSYSGGSRNFPEVGLESGNLVGTPDPDTDAKG